MRSSWSAERVLTVLALASMEGAWLTLVYVGLQWLSKADRLDLGIFQFALAVLSGLFVATIARASEQRTYVGAIIATALAATLIGAFVNGVESLTVSSIAKGLVKPGAWLLGVAVLRGAQHSDLSDETNVAERVFSIGVPGLVVFWIVATFSRLPADVAFGSAAFSATVTFVTACLLSLGISRLSDLDVEAIDRAARRRWLVLLTGVVVGVFLISLPLSAILGLPVSSALAGVVGPLVPLIAFVVSVLAIPFGLLLELLAAIFPRGEALPPPIPSLFALPSGASTPTVVPAGGTLPDVTWLLIVFAVVVAVVGLRLIASTLERRQGLPSRERQDEVRAAEPFALPPLPHFRRPNVGAARRTKPRTAVEAYRLSLAALDGRDDARRTDETPREHAARVAGATYGRDVALLATDYQLAELARVRLSAAEERRALVRWRNVADAVRRRRRG